MQKPLPTRIFKDITHIAEGGEFCMIFAQALKQKAISEGYDVSEMGDFVEDEATAEDV